MTDKTIENALEAARLIANGWCAKTHDLDQIAAIVERVARVAIRDERKESSEMLGNLHAAIVEATGKDERMLLVAANAVLLRDQEVLDQHMADLSKNEPEFAKLKLETDKALKVRGV